MRKHYRVAAPLVLMIAIAAIAIWYLAYGRARAETSALSASGTVEAVQVILSPELGGQVLEVLAQEGEAVQAGYVLVRLDDTLLQSQLAQALATLQQVQANYALIAAGPTPEQRAAAVAAAELELLQAQQALDALYENHALQVAQAQKEVAAADKALDRATQALDSLQTQADQADIDAAWAALVLAKDRLERAEKDFKEFEKKPADDVRRALFQSKLADAQKHYDAVETRYNNLVGASNKLELALAEAEVALWQAQLERARQRYEELKDAPDPDELKLAQARLEAAEASLALAQAPVREEQLALARAQLEVAQAAVAAIQAQINRMVIKAPMDGTVLTRSVEPGEVVLPGTPLLTLARLDQLSITVYMPEDRYGQIRLGQTVAVIVDSFPGEEFQAKVVRIADRAEFTPRNVQTEEGRRTTVFAVELDVLNPQAKLKPGMPVDVLFGD